MVAVAEQRATALELAVTIRSARAVIKRRMHDQPVHLPHLLEYYDASGPSVRASRTAIYRGPIYMASIAQAVGIALGTTVQASFLDSMRVETLIRSMPYFGPSRTARLLTEAGMTAATTMAGSTRRQRAALAAAIRSKLPTENP